jgi:ammonia channel protein AmtB
VHVLQMCAVMCVSLTVLGLLAAGSAAVVGFSDPRQSAPVLSALVVTLTLAGAMVAWMRFMAMAWQPTLEMAATTVLAGALMITGYALGIVPASALISGVCGLACVAMIADMLFRFRLYASHASHHGHAA